MECIRLAEVVGSVDKSFEGIVHLSFGCAGALVVARCLGEFCAEKVFAVHEMDALALTESLFELGVVCLPCHDLCVGARKIGVNDHLARVGNEHFANVRKSKSGRGQGLRQAVGVCEILVACHDRGASGFVVSCGRSRSLCSRSWQSWICKFGRGESSSCSLG